MIVNKITTGFVIQCYNTDAKEFLCQEFVAGDQVDYENEAGETIEPPKGLGYLPFDMVQPK